MSVDQRYAAFYPPTEYPDRYNHKAANVFSVPHAETYSISEYSDRPWTKPESHDPLDRLLSSIPLISEVEHLNTEKIYEVVDEKPFAIDLSDELRKVQKLKEEGRDPHSYWEFFRSQAEYYANESYAKLGAVEYTHDLVNDNGQVRMWITPMGKGAYESYKEAADKVANTEALSWYKNRSQIEADEILKWEELIMKHQGTKVLVDVSPAPFDVPEEHLEGTMFGTHSFIRLHQLVYDEQGKPYVFSRAHRTHLPPEQLEVVSEMLTSEKIPWQQLLGSMNTLHSSLKMVDSFGKPTDIRNQDIAVSVDRLIARLEEQAGLPETVSSTGKTKEEMNGHYRVLEPVLRQVFDEMARGPRMAESEDSFMERLIRDFQTWEKMLAGRLSGEWTQVAATMTQETEHEHINGGTQMQEMYYYYSQQEYQPESNGCGTGSGASRSGSLKTVFSGIVPSFSGVMNSAGMNSVFGEAKNYLEDENLCRCMAAKGPHFHCPGQNESGRACKHAIIVGKGITKCPSCGEGKRC